MSEGRKETDVVLDAVGSDEVIPIGFDMIAIGGAYVSVGLVGTNQDTFIPTHTKKMSISWFLMG
jgi:threonine dehydrogenase-like Zn-dependent dehydrogenase